MVAAFDAGFTVRTASWHGLEDILDDYPETMTAARVPAHLLWEPVAVPVYAYSGLLPDGSPTQVWTPDSVGDFVADPGHTRIVRSDTGALLDITNDTRSVIPNSEWCAFGDAIMAAEKNAKVDTMGSVDGGQKVYATILLDEPFRIGNDPSATYPMLALMNRHSEGGGMRAGRTSVRVVCKNTFGAAETEMDGHGYAYTIRHTKNWEAKMAEALATINGLRTATWDLKETMTALYAIGITDAQAEMFVQEFIPTPVGEVISPVVKRNIETARVQVRAILWDSQTTEGIRGNAYWLTQAAGEYLDHYRGSRNNDTKVGRQLLSPQRAKAKAIVLARQAAHA